MSRTTKFLFEVTAFAVTIAALLAIIALAMRMSPAWHMANGLAITVSVITAFFCVFVGVTVDRRRVPRDDSPRTSIQEELDARELRARGPRIQLR
jgi:low affinity Fe/Cu permease